MKPGLNGNLIVAVLGALVLLPACSSTHIQSARTPAGMAAAHCRNVMVVGQDERPEIRNPFEDDVVRFLHEHGLEGTGSHDHFSLDELKGDKEQVRQKLAAVRVESVLYVRVSQRADTVQGPPAGLESTDAADVNDFGLSMTTSGGEVATHLRLGLNLYRISDGVLIWSGVMDTVLKEDDDTLVVVRRVAKTIVERLAKDKLIP